jgi:serine/threonine protein kinase
VIGRRVSRFLVTGMLGEGGMGAVYRARDTELDRDVALKLLPSDMADDSERLERLQREAKAVAALQRPNIVAIHGTYAGLGRKEDAVREGELAIQLIDGSLGDQFSYRTKDLAQMQMMVGDFVKSIDSLERLVKTTGFFGPPFLRTDPTWIPLRTHPRFIALVAGGAR